MDRGFAAYDMGSRMIDRGAFKYSFNLAMVFNHPILFYDGNLEGLLGAVHSLQCNRSGTVYSWSTSAVGVKRRHNDCQITVTFLISLSNQISSNCGHRLLNVFGAVKGDSELCTMIFIFYIIELVG